MITLNISAGLLFGLGILTGVVLSAVGLFVAALISAKKK